MKNLITKFGGKMQVAALLGVLAVPVFTVAETAQAQPRHAPAWGKRNNQPARKRVPRRTQQYVRQLTGVVTSDGRGNQFSIRTGRTITRVLLQGQREPRRLNRGDTVRVTGRYGGGVFYATGLTIVRNR